MVSYQKLFDEEELIKKSKTIEISQSQKETTLKWIEKIKSNELVKEKENYGIFQDYILKDILGYSRDDILTNQRVPNSTDEVEFCLRNDSNTIFSLIELKGQNADLSKKQQGGYSKRPVEQASLYADYYEHLDFFVVSNYNSFLFFSKKYKLSKRYELKFEEFAENDFEKLKIFLYLFSKEFTIKKSIERESLEYVKEETEFSKKFYKLFLETLKLLVYEIEQSNSQISKEESIYYAQKIMDRLIFTCFAEDNDLLHDKQYIHTNFLGAISKNESLWKRLNEMFRDMNKSRKDSLGEVEIPEFNGEFFSLDLENKISIEDFREDSFFNPNCFENYSFKKKLREDIVEKLKPYSKIFRNMFLISNFDFNSDLNVNILGHIFENSLSDIEKLKNEEISKRKQDGIFYTPEYITDYMCRNTIIPYLSKSEVCDVDKLIEEYERSTDDILALEKKLSQITIVDPACGSGAFLNKAVEILLEIWNKLEEVKQIKGWYSTSTKKGSFVSFEKFNQESKIKEIIRNNIYGVDLNAESVEITKLSLFLKISNRSNPKLINLNNNIKCGNSLIGGINEQNWKLFEDDIKEILLEKDESEREFLIQSLNRKCNKSIKEQFGDEFDSIKSFNWEVEFIDIFFCINEKGEVERRGFDVVIGNPPYVNMQTMKRQIQNYFENDNYWSLYYRGQSDILYYFYIKSISNLKKTGKLSFITSRYFLENKWADKLRKYILNNSKIIDLVDFKNYYVFDDANIHCLILSLEKNLKNNYDINYFLLDDFKHNLNQEYLNNKIQKLNSSQLEEKIWTFGSSKILELILKIENFCSKKLGDISNVSKGMDTGLNEAFIVDEKIINNHNLEKTNLKKLVRNSQINNHYINSSSLYIIYTTNETNELEIPNILNYLSNFREKLEKRWEFKKGNCSWFRISTLRSRDLFENSKSKILIPYRSEKNRFGIDDQDRIGLTDITAVFPKKEFDIDIKYLSSILNSNLYYFYIFKTGKKKGNMIELFADPLKKIPIPEISKEEQQPFIEKAESMLQLHKEFYNEINFYIDNLKLDFELEKVSKKIEKFYELTKEEFLKELNKISKSKSKIQPYYNEFEEVKEKINDIKEKIHKEDEEINTMVYKLYNLTDDEIQIIEEDVRGE